MIHHLLILVLFGSANAMLTPLRLITKRARVNPGFRVINNSWYQSRIALAHYYCSQAFENNSCINGLPKAGSAIKFEKLLLVNKALHHFYLALEQLKNPGIVAAVEFRTFYDVESERSLILINQDMRGLSDYVEAHWSDWLEIDEKIELFLMNAMRIQIHPSPTFRTFISLQQALRPKGTKLELNPAQVTALYDSLERHQDALHNLDILLKPLIAGSKTSLEFERLELIAAHLGWTLKKNW